MSYPPIKILYVEDDIIDLKFFKRLVKKGLPNFSYSFARSIDTARQLLTANNFDLIIVDSLLSDGTATDFLQYVQDIPIILVSGNDIIQMKEQVQSTKVKAWLSKPLNKDSLLHAIQRLSTNKIITNITGRYVNKDNKQIPIVTHLNYINLTALTKLAGSDPIFIVEILNLYCQKMPSLLTEIRQCLHYEDWSLLADNIHKLKSSCNVIGLEKIKQTIKEIEQCENLAQNRKQVKQWISTIHQTHEKVVTEINYVIQHMNLQPSLQAQA